MKKIILIILLAVSFGAMAQNIQFDNIQTDTIDYGSKRLYLDVPEYSILNSGLFSHHEGFMVAYGFINEERQICTLTVDYSVMTYNHVLGEQSYDKELWNTFNKSHIGSRCYIKDGKYYRVDRFQDGLEIYYEHVPVDLVDSINAIMKSVEITHRDNNAPPLNCGKRRIYKQ